MKKSILILLVVVIVSLLNANGFAQPSGKIRYIFPDELETTLYDYIQKINVKRDCEIVLTLCKSENGYYEVYVNCHEITDTPLIDAADNQWAKSTHRYVVINENEYPLLLDYDYAFSTKRPAEIGTYGSRDCQVLRTIPVNDGYRVKFTKEGIIH